MKLNVAEAAEKFNVSKEAIHNRIRRGSLDCVIEHGVKYVLIDEEVHTASSSNESESKYHTYIEEENTKLKEKVASLEAQNSMLRDQKEQMLIDEKNTIEAIYKQRDEQLKQILHTITTKFLPQVEDGVIDAVADDIVEADTVDEAAPIRLKKFLKIKKYKPAREQRVRNRFKKLVGLDQRIFRKAGKIYINPAKYSYKDLLD